MRKSNHKNKNEHLRVMLFLGILFVLSSAITLMVYFTYENDFYERNKIFEYYVLNSSVTISENRVGLNADTDGLKFGIIPLGGGAQRQINITLNDLDIASYSSITVKITSRGDISKFLSFNKNNFMMEDNEEIILANIDVPLDATVGNYSGIVEVLLIKE